MNGIITFLAAILPAVLLWLYIWKKDQQPEPTSELVKAVLWGGGACLVAALLEAAIETAIFGLDGTPSNIVETTLVAFFSAAIPEESLKLLVLWLVLRKNPYFDEHYDGIVYAVSVGLGFAGLENIMYVMGEEAWVTVAISRALLAVPGHYAFAIIMGYYYSIYHFVDHSPKVGACILLVPIILHGIYDALAMSGLVDPVVGVISFFLLIYFCIKVHKFARTKMLAQIERDMNGNSFVG